MGRMTIAGVRAWAAGAVLGGTLVACNRDAGDGPYAREVDSAVPRIEKAIGLARVGISMFLIALQQP